MKQSRSFMQVMSGIMMVGQLGISLIFPILGLTVLGVYLSERFETGVWPVVVGAVVGVITAGCTYYRLMRAFLARQRAEDTAKRDNSHEKETSRQETEKGDKT